MVSTSAEGMAVGMLFIPSGKKGRLQQVTWSISSGGYTYGGQAGEKAVCMKVWNKVTFLSPDVAHSQERGLFLPVL